MKNRLCLIPFDNVFEKDEYFEEKFKGNYLDDLFSFFVEGAIDYYKEKNIKIPDEVVEKTEGEIDNQDSFFQFCNSCIEESVKSSNLYISYIEFCKENKMSMLKKKDFREKFIEKYKEEIQITIGVNKNCKGYISIKFKV